MEAHDWFLAAAGAMGVVFGAYLLLAPARHLTSAEDPPGYNPRKADLSPAQVRGVRLVSGPLAIILGLLFLLRALG